MSELKNKLKQNTESCSALLHKQEAKHFCAVRLKACHRQKCAENQSKSIFKRYDYILIKLSNITV